MAYTKQDIKDLEYAITNEYNEVKKDIEGQDFSNFNDEEVTQACLSYVKYLYRNIMFVIDKGD